MPQQKPGETISQYAIRTAWETGQFWDPADQEGLMIKQSDLKNLTASEPVVVRAMIRMSKIDMTRYVTHVLNAHGRAPDFDGELGPAMKSFILDSAARCPVPDFAPPPGVSFQFDDPDLQAVVERMQDNHAMPAIGSGGNWVGCNNRPGIHCAAYQVDFKNIDSRVAPHAKTILTHVRNAYAQIGILLIFVGMDGKDILTGESFSGTIQSTIKFVLSSSGWIGLALVGRGESCSSVLWIQLLATYIGGSTSEVIIRQQFALWAHEVGHNLGLMHTNGGIMSPSITQDAKVGVWPENDPSTQVLKSLYSGVPVPVPGGGPPPNPAPPPVPPPTSLEARMDAMAVEIALVNAKANWAVAKLREMGQ